MHLYLDIETIPAQRKDIIADIRAAKQSDLAAAIAAVKPPSNYGSEAADKWMKEKGAAQIDALIAGTESEIDAAYRKTGLDGAYGQICVIGFAMDDDAPQTIGSADDEQFILREFSHCMDSIAQSDRFNTTVVGHNVANFDLRFLLQRHVINGIRPHLVIGRAAKAKPWEIETVFDTMLQWAGIGNRISLDKLCKALSVPTPKGDLDGSKVWDAVQAGRINEVAQYCARDVVATREVHRRMTFVNPVRQIAQPEAA